MGEANNSFVHIPRYEGRIGSRKGIFPASYIEILVEPGEPRGENQNTKSFRKLITFFAFQ